MEIKDVNQALLSRLIFVVASVFFLQDLFLLTDKINENRSKVDGKGKTIRGSVGEKRFSFCLNYGDKYGR